MEYLDVRTTAQEKKLYLKGNSIRRTMTFPDGLPCGAKIGITFKHLGSRIDRLIAKRKREIQELERQKKERR